ncbi:MAG TPA: sigma-70 family RNA polymerase sigma factor [Polyangia bacterium]
MRDSAKGPAAEPRLAERFFRDQHGQLVATLARVAGLQHLELAEDAVQSAFTTAIETWPRTGAPSDPAAWLYKVAYNRLIGDLRRRATRSRLLIQAGGDGDPDPQPPALPQFATELSDDLLRMLFVCCHENIPIESRLVLALKTLCGLSTGEIALRLFTSETNVHKRLARARERLRALIPDLETPPVAAQSARLAGVHAVLYLLFNEGYLAVEGEDAIRRDLCDEAIRLTTLLAEHPAGAIPETFALLALMHLHDSRLGGRLDPGGGLLLLEEQDRDLWDLKKIEMGMQWLARAATGEVFSRFHAEAGIAAEHCLAPSFRATRWEQIVDLYEVLERVAPSPIHTMNRAMALAEWRGPEAALALVAGLAPPSWLAGSYLWEAVLADLHRRAGNLATTARHRERALALAPSEAVRRLLQRRLV